MKQQLIQGLPEFLRTDAYVFNGPKRTYQQLVTFASGKHKAATDVIKMAQGQASSSRGSTPGATRRPVDFKPRKPTDSEPLLTVDSTGPTTVLQRPVGKETDKIDPGRTYGFKAPTVPYVRGRTLDSRLPFRCYLCWETGHMAHQCPTLTEAQRKMVQKARDNFLGATRGRSQSTEVHPKADHEFHRKTRIAMVQALCEGINLSDDEADRDDPENDGPEDPKPLGKE